MNNAITSRINRVTVTIRLLSEHPSCNLAARRWHHACSMNVQLRFVPHSDGTAHIPPLDGRRNWPPGTPSEGLDPSREMGLTARGCTAISQARKVQAAHPTASDRKPGEPWRLRGGTYSPLNDASTLNVATRASAGVHPGASTCISGWKICGRRLRPIGGGVAGGRSIASGVWQIISHF